MKKRSRVDCDYANSSVFAMTGGLCANYPRCACGYKDGHRFPPEISSPYLKPEVSLEYKHLWKFWCEAWDAGAKFRIRYSPSGFDRDEEVREMLHRFTTFVNQSYIRNTKDFISTGAMWDLVGGRVG